MGKIKLKPKRKILLICALELTACATLFSTTVAWFATNRTAEVDVSGIQVSAPELLASVSYHAYHSVTPATSGVYTFEKTAVSSFTMGRYSLLNTDYQVLMEIDLTAAGQASDFIYLGAKSTATYFEGAMNNGTLVHALESSGNSFSSIINFSAFSPSQVTEETDYLSVTLADRVLDATDGADAFIDSSYALNTDVHLCTFTDQMAKFYILLDYDPELIGYIYSANIGNDILSDVSDIDSSGNSYIQFTVDFGFSFAKG